MQPKTIHELTESHEGMLSKQAHQSTYYGQAPQSALLVQSSPGETAFSVQTSNGLDTFDLLSRLFRVGLSLCQPLGHIKVFELESYSPFAFPGCPILRT